MLVSANVLLSICINYNREIEDATEKQVPQVRLQNGRPQITNVERVLGRSCASQDSVDMYILKSTDEAICGTVRAAIPREFRRIHEANDSCL
ncbi:hypothetical protein QE152_g21800 [Popillia japonica]|uniref:Uncharacterized protein n=1 Tax=Popillia japonica TaxID=7064 RepID=A0AAW1KN64_POPJA